MFVFICFVFLFTPLLYLKYFGLDVWAIRFRPYFSAGFLVFGFLLVGRIGQYFYNTAIFRWRYKQNLLKYLETELSIDEVLLLQKYSESGKKTQYFDSSSGVANNLIRAGVLYVASAEYIPVQGCPFTLTREAAPIVLNRDRFQRMVLKRTKNSN